MGSSHTSKGELEAKRKQFVDELNEVLKIFSKVIQPKYLPKVPRRVRQLGGLTGQLEVGARQYFVGLVVRSLSLTHFGDPKPPKSREYTKQELQKRWRCKWCSEKVKPCEDGRCPYCPLPLDLWEHARDEAG